MDWIGMILELTKIMLIVTYVVGVEDTFNNMYYKLQRMLFGNNVKLRDVPYVFGCSTCSTFWCCIIYGFLTYGFNINILLISCAMAFLSDIIKEILLYVKEFLIVRIGNMK